MPPAVQRGGGEFQTEVGILPGLAVFGQMVSVFVYHYLREHVGADVVATDDRMRRLGLVYARLGESLSAFMRNTGRSMISTHTFAGSRWSIREISLPMMSHLPATTPSGIMTVVRSSSSAYR